MTRCRVIKRDCLRLTTHVAWYIPSMVSCMPVVQALIFASLVEVQHETQAKETG